VQIRHRYLIEAALDPKGKWYGTVWPERTAGPALELDVEPVRQEETIALNRDIVAAPKAPGPARPQWDEWEPA
jgi:hypothetical protein